MITKINLNQNVDVKAALNSVIYDDVIRGDMLMPGRWQFNKFMLLDSYQLIQGVSYALMHKVHLKVIIPII